MEYRYLCNTATTTVESKHFEVATQTSTTVKTKPEDYYTLEFIEEIGVINIASNTEETCDRVIEGEPLVLIGVKGDKIIHIEILLDKELVKQLKDIKEK